MKRIMWALVGFAVLFHVAGGWYFSGSAIEDGFEIDPDPILIPTGSFTLQEVTYSSPVGELDAWFLPGSGDTWVIHVHGKGVTPAEAEPLFVPLQQAGYPQLAITYRNDEGQPRDPSGYYQFGATEWEDVAAAVDYAFDNGAEKVALNGFSTGAAHVLAFSFRQSLDRVAGIVLDSPNLDFGDTVSFAASKRELPLVPGTVPPTVTALAKFFVSLRIGVNWKSIDYIDRSAASLRVPVLIHHGAEDDTVPIRQSVEFEALHPDLVTLITVGGAGHVESYVVETEKYIADVLGFLQRLS